VPLTEEEIDRLISEDLVVEMYGLPNVDVSGIVRAAYERGHDDGCEACAKACFEESGVDEDEDDVYRTDGWTNGGKACALRCRALKHSP
jgi:hypothetical protein